MSAPRGVLFDAGGTLVQIGSERLDAALRASGHEPADVTTAFWRAVVRLDHEFGPEAGQWEDWFARWIGLLADHCAVPQQEFSAIYEQLNTESFLWDEPVPGARECLRRLRAAGIPVGVVSNADGRIDQALESAGLADLLDVIVDSAVVGVAKPDPAIFHHALDALGLKAAETWYLGDTVLYDAAAADAAGLQSWVVDHGGHHTLAHPRRVRSLAEFADRVLAVRASS